MDRSKTQTERGTAPIASAEPAKVQPIVVALILGTPYLIVGVIWSSTHTEHLQHMAGVDLAVSYLGSIVSWPVLLVADVCMT